MRRKLMGAFLAGMVTTASVSVFAAGGRTIEVFDTVKKVVVNKVEKPFDKNNAPFSYNGTTYVPLRFVADALGESVDWDGKTGTIFIGETENKNASYLYKDLKDMKNTGSFQTIRYSYGDPKKTAISNTDVEYSNFLTLEIRTRYENYAEIEFPLNGQFKTFNSILGITNKNKGSKGSVMFRVYLDDKEVYKKKMKNGDMPEELKLDLSGASKIKFEIINQDWDDGNLEIGLFDGEFINE